MTQLSLSYANPGSGPYSDMIGWIDWGNTFINQEDSLDITIPLKCNANLTFTLTNTITSGEGFLMQPISLTDINSPLGTDGYTGLSGHLALETAFNEYAGASSRLILSNIQVTTSSGSNLSDCFFVISNVETANTINLLSESQIYTADKNNWELLTWLGNTSTPIVNGIKESVIITRGPYGVDPISRSDGTPIFSTISPRTITIDITSDISSQALSLGIACNPPRVTRGINLFK